MILQLTRLDDRRYETVITRSDGVTFHVKGVGHMGVIPHDLAHFAVEQGLGIRGGFWGSVAQGALFGSLTHVDGRRPPHTEKRSQEILKRNTGELTETEVLVGLFNQAMEDGLGPDSPELRFRLGRYVWTPPGQQPRRFTDSDIRRVCELWTKIQEEWRTLQIGGTMELIWPESSGARRGKR
jgi:hypothetical protein